MAPAHPDSTVDNSCTHVQQHRNVGCGRRHGLFCRAGAGAPPDAECSQLQLLYLTIPWNHLEARFGILEKNHTIWTTNHVVLRVAAGCRVVQMQFEVVRPLEREASLHLNGCGAKKGACRGSWTVSIPPKSLGCSPGRGMGRSKHHRNRSCLDPCRCNFPIPSPLTRHAYTPKLKNQKTHTLCSHLRSSRLQVRERAR